MSFDSITSIFNRVFRPLNSTAESGGVLSVDFASANAAEVTPSDTTNLTAVTRGIWVGTTGDIKVDLAISGTAVVLKSVPVGLLQVQATRIYSTGTTASNLVALW